MGRDQTGSKNPSYKHGMSNHPLYQTWNNIRNRCLNLKDKDYKNYGGRYISICSEWIDDPIEFVVWCIENGWKKGLQIDRIDNDGDYEPSNCRFTNSRVNNSNKRNSEAGHIGVLWNKNEMKYRAKIKINGTAIHLGCFDFAIEAAAAYDRALDYYKVEGRRNFDNQGNWKGNDGKSIDDILDEF